MKMRKIRIAVPTSFFEWGIVFLIFKVMGASSNILPYSDTVDTMLSVIGTAFLLFSILQKRLSFLELIMYAFVLCAAIITSIKTGEMFVFLTVISCISGRRESIDRLIRIILDYESLFFLCHTVLSFLLIPFGYDMVKVYSGEERFYFGFVHPNTFSIILLNLTIMWVWLHYDGLRKIHLNRMIAVHIISYFFTRCRTSLFAMFILAVLICLFYGKENRRSQLTFWAMYCVPVFAVFIYILIYQYTSGYFLIDKIDDILNARIKLGAYAYENYGLSFWGQNLSNIFVIWDDYWQLNGHTFDCVYSYLLINYGVFWLIFIALLFYNCAIKGNEKVNIMLIVWAIYSINESNTLNPFMFSPLFLATNAVTFDDSSRRLKIRLK